MKYPAVAARVVISVIVLVLGVLVLSLAWLVAVLWETVCTRNFKYVLWEIGIRKSCPYCGAEVIVHGWPPDERYTCVVGNCRFNLANSSQPAVEIQNRKEKP